MSTYDKFRKNLCAYTFEQKPLVDIVRETNANQYTIVAYSNLTEEMDDVTVGVRVVDHDEADKDAFVREVEQQTNVLTIPVEEGKYMVVIVYEELGDDPPVVFSTVKVQLNE